MLLRKDVNVTAICDIDAGRVEEVKDKMTKAGKKAPKIFGSNEYDYRNLLELKEVDAMEANKYAGG